MQGAESAQVQGAESAQNLTPEKYRGWRKALQLMVTHPFGDYTRSIVLSFCLTRESEVLTMNLHNYTHYALPTLFQGTPLSVADSETKVYMKVSQCFKAPLYLLLTQNT